jgi:tetratricopeptide (TPR) repeat protein
MEAEVATLQARAANQAKAGKWNLAIHTLSTARERVQRARRLALRKAGPAPSDPQRHQAMKNLQAWYIGQMKQVSSGKTDRQHVIREFNSRQQALLRKYPQKTVSPTAPAASTAKLDLLLASLDDTAAEYNARRGKPRPAASQRQTALIGRLRALKAQGKTGLAGDVAEKLLKESPRDPEAIEAVGTFYQESKKFARAAPVWEGGIRMLEGGQADLRPLGSRVDRTLVSKRYLAQFCRQVAFCYSQLGRGADAKSAIDKAVRTEATLVPGSAKR